jgi:seryl-tRNA synthetase
MAKNAGSKDEYFAALDLVMNILKKHEQILDKSIQELATITEHLEYINPSYSRVENVEEKINNIQNEVTHIIGNLPNIPKEVLQAKEKDQEPQTQPTPGLSLAAVQNGLTVFLHCKQWEDFVVLAMQAQTLSFSYKDDEKVLQAIALKGNQIIKYTGALPNFSIILKAWLSRQLDTPERNIVEGF